MYTLGGHSSGGEDLARGGTSFQAGLSEDLDRHGHWQDQSDGCLEEFVIVVTSARADGWPNSIGSGFVFCSA